MTPREMKAARALLGLSQTGLAQALGVSRQTIARYETGQLPIPQLVILAIQYLQEHTQP